MAVGLGRFFVPIHSYGKRFFANNSGTVGRRDSGVGRVRHNLGSRNTPVLVPSLYDLAFRRYEQNKVVSGRSSAPERRRELGVVSN